MPLEKAPVVKAQMLIRRPVAEVFEAFIDPAITTKFWFTHATSRLEPGTVVTWEWRMYGVSGEVHVKAVDQDRRILIVWPDEHGTLCPVEWTFEPRAEGTFVQIATWGFSGSADEMVAQAIDSKGGFTMVLAGCKAFLEHGIELQLVGDHFPDARKE